jgi:lipopolysaccharide transport system ATP-binding protein
MCDGPVDQVIAAFVAEQTGGREQAAAAREFEAHASFTNIRPLRASAAPVPADGRPIDTATDFAIEWEYEVVEDGAIDQANVTFHDSQGLLLFDQAPWKLPEPIDAGSYRTRCVIPGYVLNDGRYFVSFQFTRGGQIVLDLPRALTIDVVDSSEGRFGWYGKWPGVIRPKLEWTTERLAR